MMQTEKNQVVMRPTSEPCFDFTADGERPQKKTVIISPIRIDEYFNNKFKITYECSRGMFCKDRQCKYAAPDGVDAFVSALDR